MLIVPGLSRGSISHLEGPLKEIKAAERQDPEFKKLHLSRGFAKGNLRKNSAGGQIIEALAKYPGNWNKALRVAVKAHDTNVGPTLSKETVGALNRWFESNPEGIAILTPRAANRLKRDLFKVLEAKLGEQVGAYRSKGKDALGDFQNKLGRLVSQLKSMDPSYGSEFEKKFGTFQDDPDWIKACHEELKNVHGELPEAMCDRLADAQEARENMAKAAVLRDVCAALRETRRNVAFRWLLIRISPEMRGHLTLAFGVLGGATLILSIPLMFTPIKDMVEAPFHHDQQQQQGQ